MMETKTNGSVSCGESGLLNAGTLRLFLAFCLFFLVLSVLSFFTSPFYKEWCAIPEVLLAGLLVYLFFRAFKGIPAESGHLTAVVIFSVAATDAMQFFVPGMKSLFWLILLLVMAVGIHHLLRMPMDRRALHMATAVGTLLALSVYIGWQLQHYGRFELLYIGEHKHYTAIRELFWLSGLVSLLSIGISGIFSFLMQHDGTSGEPFRKTRYCILLAAIILLCWLPYYAAYYPGFLTRDSLDEIALQLSGSQGSNHHPYIHQLMILPFLKLGQAVGNLSLGVGLFILAQMCFMALCFASCICFLKEHGARQWLLGLVFCFYALFTVNAYYSVILWKDVPFAGISLLLMIRLIEAAEGDKKTGKHYGAKNIALAVLLFLFCTLRNNGWYAFLLGFPFFILINRKQWKRFLLIGISVVMMVTAWQHFLYDSMDLRKSSVGEVLSVPLQQIARVVTVDGIDPDDEATEILEEVFSDLDDLPGLYEEEISNNVKQPSVFLSEIFVKNPLRYARAWLQLGLEHPKIYVDAFLHQCYGYWVPDVDYWIVTPEAWDGTSLGIDTSERFPGARSTLYWLQETLAREEPFSFAYSLALMFWLVITGSCLLHLKRWSGGASAVFLLIGVWLTTLASPVFCEYRYLYAVVVSVPLFLGLAVCVKNKPAAESMTGQKV